jgi:branched-chain amino acid aminotransferase
MRRESDSVLAYINGDLVPDADAVVSVFDSGLSFADGVFEGVRVYSGRVFRLEDHVRRLFASARCLEIDIRMTEDALTAEILAWLSANEIYDDFHFRPIVTRGRRFPPRLDPRFCAGGPTILFIGADIGSSDLNGLRVVISSVRRVAPDALDPRIKSLNYGNNLLARLEANRRKVDDAIMLDDRGLVAEATGANLFIASDRVLTTPRPRACLEGITRSAVIDLAVDRGLDVTEGSIRPEDLLTADEVFLTGTAVEIAPVVEIDGRAIGHGAAGPITLALAGDYAALVRSGGTSIVAAHDGESL